MHTLQDTAISKLKLKNFSSPNEKAHQFCSYSKNFTRINPRLAQGLFAGFMKTRLLDNKKVGEC